ncbi:DUF6443 domain-containing protein [Bacteroides sp. GD17]|jgi:RHS repeat-associated protein|uniref:DUF6443 domain-containing protein n=1 Tax=Bacteroides sp. GD17 TaxID=3139826 RepID=UPI0025E9E3AA|nr:DUF6443 domain-containing protein [uncultured Bacteroides sp.]
MKRIYLLLIFMFAYSAITLGQVSTESYIRTRTMLKNDGKSYTDGIIYYDGLGRPMQTVQKHTKNGNPDGKILATLQEYDAAGRESNTWLPIVASSDFTGSLTFKSSAPGNYENDINPYSKQIYESSPLKRIVEQYGPGQAWHAGHPIATTYTTNLTSAPYNCINYSVSSTGTLTNGGPYMANQLYVTQTTDEDGNNSYTFVDKQDRTLLERHMKGSETHDTYYVYDSSNRLCFVLQPMYQSSANLDLYAFQYKYDTNDNCIWKKEPGTQYVEYVYDTRDRLAFSQDGNQRAAGNKWTFYEYDYLNRLTRQGECTNKTVNASSTVHIVNYYDAYTFIGQTGFDNSFPTGDTRYGKGHPTGSILSVLNSNDKIYTAYFYDIKGRVTMNTRSNLLGGRNVTTITYTFTNKPATVSMVHTASGKTTREEVYTYSYDYADRVSKVEHTLGGSKITLYDCDYDKFGRLYTKSLHGSATNKLTYAYNLRSWLTGITATRFTQNLYYNTGVGTAKYNGNISSTTWKAGNETTLRGYKFTYDGLSRLLNATYGETASISTNANRFSENVTAYDKNGNITKLQRYGQTGASAFGLIDDLTYTLSGNQLNRVDDAVTATAYNSGFEFKDKVKQAGEYAYDANGNLTKDLNKGITGIQYNVLNLPSVVTFGDGSITYTYAADGTKLRTVHRTGSTSITTDYCGNVIYENGTAKQLLTEEGYVSLSDNKYHYYLKDHQGNNRVVINSAGTPEETNHYYPFGGVFANAGNAQPYKYNGKELDAKKGLNWYDYGARHYDAAVGRFMTVDPLAEKYYPTSPYTYCANNPVRFIDTDGKKIVDTNGNIIYTKDNGWTPNASQDAVRIGNAMMQTRTGTTQFNKMVDTDYDITLSISPESKIESNNGKSKYRLGTSKKHFTNGKLSSVDIIIFEGTLDKYIYAKTSKAKKYRVSIQSNDEAIGAIATHESVHVTDEQNIKDSKENDEKGTFNDVERTPIEAEMNVLRELFNQHNLF